MAIEKLRVENTELRVDPNPANEIIRLSNSNTNDVITISDIAGNITLQTNVNANKEIDISRLSVGLYFINVQSKNGLLVGKFVKE